MREAIGGALLIKLVMFFIAIYICVLSVAINYSITFRVKNQIINLIEEYESVENASDAISSYLAKVGYFRPATGRYNAAGCQQGYCVEEIESKRGSYYKVTTFVSFSFPIIGDITNLPVTGETKVIYGPV